jgi:hypothetical protein
MARQYLAFDIETAKDVPGDDFNWRPHRPLGISSQLRWGVMRTSRAFGTARRRMDCLESE